MPVICYMCPVMPHCAKVPDGITPPRDCAQRPARGRARGRGPGAVAAEAAPEAAAEPGPEPAAEE